jgi:tetratricopeptide (TPR) repeat protein
MRFFNLSGSLFRGLLGSIFVLALACCLGLDWAVAQSSQMEIERIEMLRGQIKTAEAQHDGAQVVGELWLKLADRYLDQLEFPEAEDAYARSLKLLRAAGTQAGIADALDGMGVIDLAARRFSEARECDKKALAIYEALGDRVRAGKMHEAIALAWLVDRHHREAELESAAGLAELQQQANPDAGEMIAAYLTHSDALCSLKRCELALKDVDHAMEIVRAKFPVESSEMVAVLLTRGVEEWKTKAIDEAGRSMEEALRLVHGLTGLPELVRLGDQLGVLQQYDAFLKATHRGVEAAAMEDEMARLQSQQHPPSGCNGCTVSAAALGFMP